MIGLDTAASSTLSSGGGRARATPFRLTRRSRSRHRSSTTKLRPPSTRAYGVPRGRACRPGRVDPLRSDRRRRAVRVAAAHAGLAGATPSSRSTVGTSAVASAHHAPWSLPSRGIASVGWATRPAPATRARYGSPPDRPTERAALRARPRRPLRCTTEVATVGVEPVVQAALLMLIARGETQKGCCPRVLEQETCRARRSPPLRWSPSLPADPRSPRSFTPFARR